MSTAVTDVPVPHWRLQEWVQKKWDEYAKEFADDIAHVCPDDPKHTAADLWLNLDDCPVSDETGGVNYAYGMLGAFTDMAIVFGLELKCVFPEASHA